MSFATGYDQVAGKGKLVKGEAGGKDASEHPTPKGFDKDVLERILRGRDRLMQMTGEINEALEHWRGNHYWYVNAKGILEQQFGGPAGVRAPGKPSWRVRESHNVLFDFVAHEVSKATARTPGYEVVPATGDPEDESSAKMAENVAVYGHDMWDTEEMAEQVISHAVITGEGFVWPYWDDDVGPFIKDEAVGLGDVCNEVYGKGQVFWEPGQKFKKSKWHCVDVAMTPEAVKAIEGYNGPAELETDADTVNGAQRGYSQPARKMVMVTNYLERPSKEIPEGRWLTLVSNREVVPPRPYPGSGKKPCLIKLSYAVDPESDRDIGLVPQLLPASRQYDDASNKITEWKNLYMMGGRAFVTPGLMGNQRLTDEPGVMYQVPQPNENVKVWEAPPIPPELFQIREDALAEMARIAAQNDIPAAVESGKGIVTLTERDASRAGAFLKRVAAMYAGVMTADLALVQKYYTEDRLIQIKGDFGWESYADFQGAQLGENIDVRVNAASIEPLTREGVEQRVIAFADRMWISPEEAMQAIATGTAEHLLDRMLRAEARVHRVIRRIKEGTVFEMGTRIVPAPPDPITGQRLDPMTGMPSMEVPGWMPLPWDNLRIWRDTFEGWFATEYAETMPEDQQEASNLIYRQILDLEAQEAMLQQQRQAQMAEQLGMGNAAQPQGPPSMPDMNKLGASDQGGGAPTPNQPPSQSTPS